MRVLIVEDSEPFRRAAVAVVHTTGCFVVAGVVDSGEDCLRAVAVLHPDLVLMDVGLPGIDGVETAGQLTRGDDGPVVVLVSTRSDTELADRGVACGAAGYIDKSVFGREGLDAVWAAASGRVTRTSRKSPEVASPT